MMFESRRQLKHLIHQAAKDCHPIVLYTLLSEHCTNAEASDVLNEDYVEDDGQRYTPLIVAARHGSNFVCKIIVNKFNVDLEAEGIVKFEDYVVEGASALWCAAGGGHLSVVKTLVKAGADVNHATRTNSTPLRAACFDGRLDIVKYLARHGANIHIANNYNNTCLMIAAYKGHLHVVNYLLENDANPNEKALCGGTALHFAAECNHVKIVKKLLEYNADLHCVNDNGMTPLKAAAERVSRDVVEFILDTCKVHRKDEIDALELLGASFANDRDNYSLDSAYYYLERAMKLRYADENNVIRKILIAPVSAYEYWMETQTLDELQTRLRHNSDAIHMESLTIRERILGIHNPELWHPVIYRGAVFADSARFDRCIDLWLHAVKLKQSNQIDVSKDLLRFAQVLSQMLHIGIAVACSDIQPILECIIIELQHIRERLLDSDLDTLLANVDRASMNLTTAIYLVAILTIVLNKRKISKDVEFDIYRVVYKLVAIPLKTRSGQTLLHLACNSETPIDDFHIHDICKFPCANTASLLIDCGANVNAMDYDRNTPLHLIVNYTRSISDFSTLHTIIMKLIDSGAHLDCVNNRGDTALDSSATGVAEIILQTQFRLNLKCLAARQIKNNKIAYRGIVPDDLAAFIDLHGPEV